MRSQVPQGSGSPASEVGFKSRQPDSVLWLFIFLHFSTFGQRGKQNRSAYSCKNTPIKIVITPVSIGSEDCSLFPASLGTGASCITLSGASWSWVLPPAVSTLYPPDSCLSGPAAPPEAGQRLGHTWLPKSLHSCALLYSVLESCTCPILPCVSLTVPRSLVCHPQQIQGETHHHNLFLFP